MPKLKINVEAKEILVVNKKLHQHHFKSLNFVEDHGPLNTTALLF